MQPKGNWFVLSKIDTNSTFFFFFFKKKREMYTVRSNSIQLPQALLVAHGNTAFLNT